MTLIASEKAYRRAGIGPSDVQVIELHDCFSANELISYEALGLCEEGWQHKTQAATCFKALMSKFVEYTKHLMGFCPL